MKKTITNTAFLKHPPQKRFTGFVFGLILVFGLFSGFLVKPASASNNYVDEVFIYLDTNFYWRLHFHVKTTFGISYSSTGSCNYGERTTGKMTDFSEGHLGADSLGSNPVSGWYIWTNGGITYTAGNSYDLFLARAGVWGTGQITGRRYYDLCACGQTNYDCGYYLDYLLNKRGGSAYFNAPTNETFKFTLFSDSENYPVITYPTLTISFPHDNDEIAGAFYIDGNYSVPSLPAVLWLNAQIVGYTGTLNLALLELATTTGAIHELVPATFGLPVNYYILKFKFSGDWGVWDSPLQIPIHVVSDLPPALPTGETTPTIPQYGGIPADVYYTAHSVYATSTGLYNDLKDAVGGVVQNIGENLAQFANKFSLTDAQTSGLNLANSILTMRAYVGGINSFFGTLPVAQFLILYLIAFLGVVIFRLIKGLINLIKL